VEVQALYLGLMARMVERYGREWFESFMADLHQKAIEEDVKREARAVLWK
jgi:hypothetical protein